MTVRADTAPLRAVIVGAGLMGRWHADAIKHAGGRAVGVVDVEPGAARKLAHDTGAQVEGKTLAEVLGRAEADVVHICTPADTHEPLARTAFEAGCHVLCEKPVAPEAETVGRLYRLAGEHGVLLCPVHQYACQRGFERAKEMVPAGGRLLHVDAVACSAGAAGGSAEEMNDLVREILPHPLSMIWELLNELPADWAARRTTPGEWRLLASVGETGIGILLSATGRPTRNTLRLICERQTIHVDLYHGFAVRESGAVSRGTKLARPFRLGARTVGAAGRNLARRTFDREWAFPGLRLLTSRFYRAIEAGEPAPLSEAHAVSVAEAVDRVLMRIETPSHTARL